MDKTIDFVYLLDRMFPANSDTGWPAFSSLDDDTFTQIEPFFDKILPLISEIREIFFEIENVNDQIKFLKKLSYTDTNAFVEIDGVYIKTLEADNDSLRVSIKELKRELEEMRNKYSVLEKEKEFELQLAQDDIDCLRNANSCLKDDLTALEEITFVA